MAMMRGGLLAAALVVAAMLPTGCGRGPAAVSSTTGGSHTLDAGEVEAILEAMGTEAQRYVVNLPYAHRIDYQVIRYRQGRPVGGEQGGSTESPEARPPYTLLVVAHGSRAGEELRLGVADESGGLSFSIGMGGEGAAAGGFQRLGEYRPGRPMVLYVWARGKEGVPDLARTLQEGGGGVDALGHVARQCDELAAVVATVTRLRPPPGRSR